MSIERIFRVEEILENAHLDTMESDDYFTVAPISEKTLSCIFKQYPDEISARKMRVLQKRTASAIPVETYVGMSDRKIVGYYSIARAPFFDSVIKGNQRFPAGVFFLLDDYTFKCYRHKGFHKRSINARMIIGKREGFNTARVAILSSNTFSKHAYFSCGFSITSRVYIFNLKFLALWFSRAVT